VVDETAREEFHAYVVTAGPGLLRAAYLMTGDRGTAEDLVQTALAKTYLAWPRIRDREAVDGYVWRVMLNSRTSWWRKARHERTVPLEQHPAEDVPHRDVYADADLHDALWRALALLPRRQRAAIVLRYYEDLSEADTAAALGVSVGTVKSTVSKALRKLRDHAGLREDERTALPSDLSTTLHGASS
jgi:RNA polymerase sigma-70 factor (sigma-E family)